MSIFSAVGSDLGPASSLEDCIYVAVFTIPHLESKAASNRAMYPPSSTLSGLQAAVHWLWCGVVMQCDAEINKVEMIRFEWI